MADDECEDSWEDIDEEVRSYFLVNETARCFMIMYRLHDINEVHKLYYMMHSSCVIKWEVREIVVWYLPFT